VADGFDDGDELAGGVNDVDEICAFLRQSMSVMTEQRSCQKRVQYRFPSLFAGFTFPIIFNRKYINHSFSFYKALRVVFLIFTFLRPWIFKTTNNILNPYNGQSVQKLTKGS
jgi:hypothetical protein